MNGTNRKQARRHSQSYFSNFSQSLFDSATDDGYVRHGHHAVSMALFEIRVFGWPTPPEWERYPHTSTRWGEYWSKRSIYLFGANCGPCAANDDFERAMALRKALAVRAEQVEWQFRKILGFRPPPPPLPALRPGTRAFLRKKNWHGQDRSGFMLLCACRMVEDGWPDDAIAKELKAMPLNKYRGRRDEDQRIRATVTEARRRAS